MHSVNSHLELWNVMEDKKVKEANDLKYDHLF